MSDETQRFLDNVMPEPNSGCWLWMGSQAAHGYGMLSVNGKPCRAHRVSWEMYNGPIPDGLHILHKCDNPPCVNPSHLYAGTHKDNMRDRSERRRHHEMKKTHCRNGHPFDGDNVASKPNSRERVCVTCRRINNEAYRRRKGAKRRKFTKGIAHFRAKFIYLAKSDPKAKLGDGAKPQEGGK